MEQKQILTKDIRIELEEEIKKAFEQVSPDEKRVASVLSLLSLRPIERLLFMKYKIWTGDDRLKYSPIAVIRSLLLKDLKDIYSSQKLIAYLYANPDERILLGFYRFVPSTQTYSIIRRKRIDAEIQHLMDFVVVRIWQFANKNGRPSDINLFPTSFERNNSHIAILPVDSEVRHINGDLTDSPS